MAGALCALLLLLAPALALGQDPRPAPDTVRIPRDSVRAGRDTVTAPRAPAPFGADTLVVDPRPTRDSVPRDTIKAPFARGELPLGVEIDGGWRFDRAALDASGALTLADLLDRVPGLTTFRAAWLVDPQSAAWLGDVGRVRVYVDGLAVDPVDPRAGGALDLTTVPLWLMEEARIERTAGEVRVHLRTWRVDRTTPYSRVDVYTGDLETNVFRGWFGRRFGPGLGLQAAGQSGGVRSGARTGGGDGTILTYFGRFGRAWNRWSVDAAAMRLGVDRSAQGRLDDLRARPAEVSRHQLAYARAAWGDPDAGPWVQLIGALQDYRLQSGQWRVPGDTTVAFDSTRLRPVPLDSFPERPRAFRAQWLATGGTSFGALRVSAAARMRVFEGRSRVAPQLRAEWARGFAAVSAFAERDADSVSRLDLTARLSPFGRVAFLGALSRQERADALGTLGTTALRLEAGARFGRGFWASGGVLARDSAVLTTPALYDTTQGVVRDGDARGAFVALRGPVWKDVGADLWAVAWEDTAALLRPRLHTRSQLYVRTRWLSRFPSGSFGLFAAVTHEYREPLTAVLRPTLAAAAVPSPTTFMRDWSTILEIRILTGTLFWQFRNVRGETYTQFPGFLLPRARNVYGIRWEFWN